MSDSAATEIKFNSLLEEYRATVLPYTLENYNTLDEDGKLSVSRLMLFFFVAYIPSSTLRKQPQKQLLK